ncbi:putative major capsid protein [Peanut chlorotic streak virus]|uniref:Coat protein n=1 Tax=Peanut chlorotic streak virus TaxID=35593 RepID=Q84681_9VIRU|nr:hypothetical protein [Peanut chlorotic streak virus]AAA50239.1 putative major capsid protein [Peanut chlorotic streak virus]
MDNIDRLTQLLEKMNLGNMAKLDEEDAEGIIRGIDSDDEGPTFNMEKSFRNCSPSGNLTPSKRPKVEEGETSQQEDFQAKLDKSFRDYSYKKIHGKTDKKVPFKYLQKERGIEDGILNNHCAENQEELILAWINRLKLKVQSGDETIRNLALSDFVTYLQYQTTGVLADWAQNTQIPFPQGLTGSETTAEAKLQYLNRYAQEIFSEFIGYGPDEARKEDKPNIIRILSNMKLCDPCYIENFFCQVEANYYKVTDRTGLLDIVLSKMPPPMVTYIQTQINDPSRTRRILTLGLIRRFAIEYRQNLCLRKIEKNYIRNVDPKCCKQLDDVPQEYGCSQPYRYKKKRKPFRRIKARKYPYRKWKPKYRYKVRRKGYSKQQNKQKTCPRGKKTCRCWICQEEGHYANECPNRKINQKKDKYVRMLYSVGYEPIEEDYETDESLDFDIYSLTSETDSETESENEFEE